MRKDKHTEADRLLRDGLDGLQPDYPSGSWERLARRLDEQSVPSPAEKEDARFDGELRERLISLTPAYEPASWEHLEGRLENQAAADAQALEDEAISEQLNALVPAYNATSWDALKARLDNAESDSILHHRLTTSAPEPTLSGWAALAARLELIAARRTAIYCYKFSEFCVILALLLLFWRFFPEGESVTPFRPLEEPVAALVSPSSAFDAEDDFTVAEIPLDEEPNVLTEETGEPASAAVEPLREASRIDAAAIQELETKSPPTFERSGEAISQLSVRLGPALALEKNPPHPSLSPTGLTLKGDNPRTFHLRPFISPWDFNQVVTPKQVVNDIILEQDIRISYGASAGVLLDVSYRKHTMQYGLIYGRRSYLPTVLKEVEDFLPGQGPIERRDTNYSRISIQAIQLPAVLQWELFDNNRWRMTADAGLAVNVNVWKKFQKSPTFDSDVLNWSRQTPQTIGGGRGDETENLNRIGARDLVFPEQGLFQGGSLLENVSMTASIGFSIERYLSERTSVYVAPRFSRAIYYQKSSGVEPFNDRIHNNSVQFGTRILLGRQK